MCGIAGLWKFDGQEVHQQDIEIMLNKIEHRGRDHVGIALRPALTTSEKIGLGHRRLSIIDLNQCAAQPMYYADNYLCLTYNGEIYNYAELKNYLQEKRYTFTTQSDTEVLLAAYHYWGKQCVNYLNGMFAFALWDEKNKQLFCARDALGIKPFFYTKTTNFFAFSSESIALTHLSPFSLNNDALFSYLLSMYVVTDVSIFSGIQKLPAAHTLIIRRDGSVLQEKFWEVKRFEGLSLNEDNVDQLNDLIKKSVKRQLQSDVPVGGFLSGGVDSGLITALAAPDVRKYYTYSVGYEGLIDNELSSAKRMAERYATCHTEVTLSSQEAMVNLNLALKKMSEPIADPAIAATYLLSKLAAADGVKVLLNGTGGDEVFGGYTRYTGQLSILRKMLSVIPASFHQTLSYLTTNHKLKSRLKSPALDMIFSTGGSYLLAKKWLNDEKYLKHYLSHLAESLKCVPRNVIPALYQKMLFDMQVYLPNELLFLLDQMTMAHTVEGRVPLLDVDVIQLSYQFFSHEHARRNRTKILLKQIALPFLGREHVQRKKQGFAGSAVWWVKQHFHEFIEVIASIHTIPYFEDFNIDAYLKQGTIDESKSHDIFILYCLVKWYEKVKGI